MRHSSIMLNRAIGNVTGWVTVLHQAGNDAKLQSMQDQQLQILLAIVVSTASCLQSVLLLSGKVATYACAATVVQAKRNDLKNNLHCHKHTIQKLCTLPATSSTENWSSAWIMIARGDPTVTQAEAGAWRGNCMKHVVHCEMRKNRLNSWKQGFQLLCKKQLT